MTDLREELARALHPIQAVSFDECDTVTRGVYYKVADGLLPIVSRAVAAEREACAKAAETVPIETYASPPYIAQTQQARVTIVAAIRARRDV